MREIKFRVWVKNKKCIKNIIQLDFLNNQVLFDDLDFEKFNDVELMQYTGLHDKNGKEIYEGDIVKLLPPCKEITAVVKIGKFYDEDADDWFIGVYIESDNICVSVYAEEGKFLEYFEIIGNIYEDPELLDKV